MEEIIFKTEQVVKRYKGFRAMLKKGKNAANALDGLDMEIRRGEIYGFVGKNGAGKTTLLRVIAGAVLLTGGTMELFGERDPEKMHLQRRRINGLIEGPALNQSMTAQDNLKVCCMQRGLDSRQCIDEVLEQVGLTQFELEKRKVREFSLGMKQRLGIAMALLGNPEFLFLDEPLNGLDPEGIRDFRELMLRLNQEQGTTILISSHQLRELTQIATCYGFIDKGKMIEQITAQELEEKTSDGDLEGYFLSLIYKNKLIKS